MIAELSSGEEAAGTFVAVDASALTLWIDGTAKRILKEDIRTLVRIRASHRRGTVLVGAIAGAAVGLLMVADQEDYNARGRLLFASVGGGVGAAIGAAFRKQTTREVVYMLNPEVRGASLYSLVLPPCRRFRELTLSIPGENSTDSARPLAFITREPIASLIETCGRSGRLR